MGAEEVEPGDGWPYDAVLSALAAKPSMTPRELSSLVVDKYIRSYRASDNVTQSACDIGKAEAVAAELNALAQTLTAYLGSSSGKMTVIRARSSVQAFYTADYVDLADLCGLLASGTADRRIRAACAAVIDGLTKNGMVVKCGRKGADVSHSNGVSIYFPTKKISPLYARLDFTKQTKWGQFLKAYVGKVRER